MVQWELITSASRIFSKFVKVPGMTPGHHAVASLTEVGDGDVPFLGDATMKVYNVVPHYGSVEVRGEVDWDNDIRIRITVMVSDL
jgi:hypothetical protein